MPPMRFLFVRPVLCLRLPSDIPSQVCPCLQLILPLTGCIEDLHLQVPAPCRAHHKKGVAPLRTAPNYILFCNRVFEEDAYKRPVAFLSDDLNTSVTLIPVDCGCSQFLLNAEQLVVLGDPVGTAQ